MAFADLVAQANALNAANAPGSHAGPTPARGADGSAPYADLFYYLNAPGIDASVPSSGGEGGSAGPLPDRFSGNYAIPDKYKGILTPTANGGLDIDWSKLPAPSSPWGLGMQSGPDANTLKNKNLQFDDPNFGWTTPAQNVNSPDGTLGKIANTMPAIIGALGTAGFGSIIGAPLLTSLFSKVAGGEMSGNLGVNDFVPSPQQILQLLQSGG